MILHRFTRFVRASVFLGGVPLLLLVLSPILQAQSFSVQSLMTASNPEDVIAVDLNHDFLPDLVILHRSSATLSVYLNLGGGKFSTPYTYATAPGPISIDAVDVNEDGNLDLIVGSSTMAAFSVYIGNGNGTFLPPRDYSVQGWPVSLSVTGNRGFPGETGATEVLSVSIDQISLAEGRPQETTFVEGELIYQLTDSGHLTHGILADFTNDKVTDILFAKCSRISCARPSR
jgi:hypothetical protein